MMHFAETVLYTVNLDSALAIPIAYFVSVVICVFIRELTHGVLKYVLALMFLGSFSALWFIALLDYSPLNFILIGVILFGGVSGLWHWLRDIFKDMEKL